MTRADRRGDEVAERRGGPRSIGEEPHVLTVSRCAGNQSALGLVCTGCGYLHEFVGDTVRVQPT